MKTNLSPPPKEVRLTIPVSAEVHSAFSRIAKAGKMPVGRAMGEWLQDTIDAANFMAEKMEQARRAPRLVAQEMHAYALGLADETQQALSTIRDLGKAARSGSGAPPSPGGPPPCNTGGKVPAKSRPGRGGKST